MKLYTIRALFGFTLALCSTQSIEAQYNKKSPKKLTSKGSQSNNEVTHSFLDVKNLVMGNETISIVFLSPSCPCSQSHTQHLNQLFQEKHKIIGIITEPIKNKNLANVRNQMADVMFPLFIDNKQKFVKKYKALKTPHTVIINKGKILYSGGVTNSAMYKKANKFYLKDNLNSLKQKQTITHKTGESLGCYIRRI